MFANFYSITLTGVPGFIQYATNNGDASDIKIDFVELEETQYEFITSNIKLYDTMPVQIQFERECEFNNYYLPSFLQF